MRRGKLVSNVITYFLLAVMLVFGLFPIYWIAVTSLKSERDVYVRIPELWPKKPTFDSYRKLIFETGFLRYLKNSLVVSLVTTVVTLIASTLAGYSIARLRFRGRAVLSPTILLAYLMPPTMLFIPLYMLITRWGLQDNLWGLVAIYPTLTVPYATWMLASYFQGIPVEIEEAAVVDGCSRMKALWEVVLPLASPGLISTSIFSFTICWSEFLYALVIITTDSAKTIPLGLSGMMLADVYVWGQLMGGAMIATLPVIILYTLASKYIVGGLTLGAVKG